MKIVTSMICPKLGYAGEIRASYKKSHRKIRKNTEGIDKHSGRIERP